MCNILAIDTSTQHLSLAICQNEQVLKERSIISARAHSVHLHPEIEQLLNPKINIDLIAVGQGPGSYTGIRVGVTAAKVLAWTWKVPVIGISSLEALAFEYASQDGFFMPIIDGRRGRVYTALFEKKQEQWIRHEADGIRDYAEWVKEMKEKSEGALTVVGEIKNFPFCETGMMEGTVKATSIAKLAMQHPIVDQTYTLLPNYTQLAEAEWRTLK